MREKIIRASGILCIILSFIFAYSLLLAEEGRLIKYMPLPLGVFLLYMVGLCLLIAGYLSLIRKYILGSVFGLISGAIIGLFALGFAHNMPLINAMQYIFTYGFTNCKGWSCLIPMGLSNIILFSSFGFFIGLYLHKRLKQARFHTND